MNDSQILTYLRDKDVNWKYVNSIKTVTDFNDDIISGWLNVNVKTFRAYRKPDNILKDNVKEQVLLLLSLIKHGIEVFGSAKDFGDWLNKLNLFLDKSPVDMLNTVTGIKFIDDRLTAIEYGDNV